MARTRTSNKWTYEQRLCLDVLWTSQPARLPPRDRVLAFNTIFEKHLTACGNPEGLSQNAICAQYTERSYTHKPTWNATWARVCAVPKLDLALREELQRKIDAVLRPGETIQAGRAATRRETPPPETPRRTERVRKATQNPYTPYTDHGNATSGQQQRPDSQVDATFNPYATPGPSTRKRPAATRALLPMQIENDDIPSEDEYVPKAKRARFSSPRVFVSPPPEELAVQAPLTPHKSPRRRPGAPRHGANMLFTQPSGRELMLKPKEHEQASRPLKDVPEEAAHPYPPALLFRFWHDKSHGINSSEGFVSGKFVPKNILVEPRGPPDCDTIDMNDFAHHLNNRTGTDQDGIPSPL